MVLGLILTEWDTQVGPLIKARFPNNFQMSKEIINKLLMSHSISKELKAEMNEKAIKWAEEKAIKLLEEKTKKDSIEMDDLKVRLKEQEKA
jgi:hypothetical protein